MTTANEPTEETDPPPTPLERQVARHKAAVDGLKALHRLSDPEANYLADLMMQEGREG